MSDDREPLRIKMSSKKSGSSYVWTVGVPDIFLKAHPDEPERIKLVVENNTIFVIFGSEGIRLTFNKVSSVIRWATLSKVWIQGIAMPRSGMLATELDALYDPTSHKIEINKDDYTPQMRLAIDTHLQPNLDELEQSDTFKTKPRIPKVPKKGNNKSPAPVLDLIEPVQKPKKENAIVPYALPNKVAAWHDENVKNLRELIMDLQMRRPDIIFQVSNGVVIMRKQTFEDI